MIGKFTLIELGDVSGMISTFNSNMRGKGSVSDMNQKDLKYSRVVFHLNANGHTRPAKVF